MSFENLLSSANSRSTLIALQQQYAQSRASLLKIRSERLRLARTGWRPTVPTETRLIRSAEWKVERSEHVRPYGDTMIETDIESKFIPIETNFFKLAAILDESSASQVRIRGLEIGEPRYAIQGRPVCAAFFDLVFVLERDSDALISLPKVDGYLEARFWSDVLRTTETGLGLPAHSIRVEVGVETLGGVVEADEILFELKDQVERLRYDPRGELMDTLRLDSATPILPSEDFALNPWGAIQIKGHFESLQAVTRKRGVSLNCIQSRDPSRSTVPFSLESVHANMKFAFSFLREWFSGEADDEGKDWIDLDLARAIVWTAIQSGYLREENYDAWKAEFGPQPFESGSASEAALRTLDPLLRTSVFPESSASPAFTALLEIEKTRSVRSLSRPTRV